MKTNIAVVLILAFILSCKTDPNNQIDEGKIIENIYHSEEIGWTMKIPNGWEINHRSELEKRNKKGLELINETAGIDYNTNELKQLLNLQKDKFHIFQSTSEPFKIEYEGAWEANNKEIYKLLHKTYTSQGNKIDTTISKVTINNLQFELFHITMYTPNGRILLHQDMYSKHINGYDFGVNLNYIDDKYKKEIMDAWKSSTFK